MIWFSGQPISRHDNFITLQWWNMPPCANHIRNTIYTYTVIKRNIFLSYHIHVHCIEISLLEKMNKCSLSMSRKYLNNKSYFTFYHVYLGEIVTMFPHHMLETKICLLLNCSTCKKWWATKRKGKNTIFCTHCNYVGGTDTMLIRFSCHTIRK